MSRTAHVFIVVALLGIAGCSSSSSGSARTAATSATAAGTSGTPAPSAGATGTDALPGTTTDGSTTATASTTTDGSTTATASTTTRHQTVAPVTAPADVTPTASLVAFATVDAPVGIAVRPGDDRIFVVSQTGVITPVTPDGKAGTPVLDISSSTTATGEQGLLGLAFHPTQPFAYIDYTSEKTGNTEIEEYKVSADGTFDPGSRRLVLEIDQPYANHNGGQLAFGPDGDLYIGMGDGGGEGDPGRTAQNLGQLLGKILRIDPLASGSKPYTVPADNPFVGVAGAKPEIWTLGMRNPFRFSFDPATKDLWIADVGQDQWEEIDVAWAADGGGRGENFGWSAFEGDHPYNTDQHAADAVGPIHEYAHGDLGCSIIGGARYRGAAIASLQGWYVYGDYCSGQVRALQINGRTAGKEVVLGKPGAVSEVAAGPDGELYVSSDGDNQVFKITAA
jgi:glucose/arabinose dehydrogenase